MLVWESPCFGLLDLMGQKGWAAILLQSFHIVELAACLSISQLPESASIPHMPLWSCRGLRDYRGCRR